MQWRLAGTGVYLLSQHENPTSTETNIPFAFSTRPLEALAYHIVNKQNMSEKKIRHNFG